MFEAKQNRSKIVPSTATQPGAFNQSEEKAASLESKK